MARRVGAAACHAVPPAHPQPLVTLTNNHWAPPRRLEEARGRLQALAATEEQLLASERAKDEAHSQIVGLQAEVQRLSLKLEAAGEVQQQLAAAQAAREEAEASGEALVAEVERLKQRCGAAVPAGLRACVPAAAGVIGVLRWFDRGPASPPAPRCPLGPAA